MKLLRFFFLALFLVGVGCSQTEEVFQPEFPEFFEEMDGEAVFWPGGTAPGGQRGDVDESDGPGGPGGIRVPPGGFVDSDVLGSLEEIVVPPGGEGGAAPGNEKVLQPVSCRNSEPSLRIEPSEPLSVEQGFGFQIQANIVGGDTPFLVGVAHQVPNGTMRILWRDGPYGAQNPDLTMRFEETRFGPRFILNESRFLADGDHIYGFNIFDHCNRRVFGSINVTITPREEIIGQKAPIPEEETCLPVTYDDDREPVHLVVEIYQDVIFGGGKATVVTNAPRVPHDRISSVRILKGPNYFEGVRVKLCEDVNYAGRCVVVEPGSYPRMGDLCSSSGDCLRDNQLDSIEIMTGNLDGRCAESPEDRRLRYTEPIPLIARVFENMDFTGQRMDVLEDQPRLPLFNDIISSAIVWKGPDFSASQHQNRGVALYRDNDFRGRELLEWVEDEWLPFIRECTSLPFLGACEVDNDAASSIRFQNSGGSPGVGRPD